MGYGLYTLLANRKIMLNEILPLEKIRKIALDEAKIILKEVGISENDRYYAIKQYEMQFKIYHAIKDALELK